MKKPAKFEVARRWHPGRNLSDPPVAAGVVVDKGWLGSVVLDENEALYLAYELARLYPNAAKYALGLGAV